MKCILVTSCSYVMLCWATSYYYVTKTKTIRTTNMLQIISYTHLRAVTLTNQPKSNLQ